jgi:hypothetical protein
VYEYEVIVYGSDDSEITIHEWIETATQLGRPIPQPKVRLAYA